MRLLGRMRSMMLAAVIVTSAAGAGASTSASSASATAATLLLLTFMLCFLRMARRMLMCGRATRCATIATAVAQFLLERFVIEHHFSHIDFSLFRFDLHVNGLFGAAIATDQWRLACRIFLFLLGFTVMRTFDWCLRFSLDIQTDRIG